jgi:hypothetical protein
MSTPTSLMVAIWSLRSVPISMSILMFLFNSGSIHAPKLNVHFWLDTIALIGIVSIIAYWHRLKRLRWNASFTVYLYIFLILILRNPYEIITTAPEKISMIHWQSIVNTTWVGLGIFALAMCLEVLIFQLRQYKVWSWWVAVAVSILYVCSIVFFFSGTLGIWSLLDTDTKYAFKRRLGYRKN